MSEKEGGLLGEVEQVAESADQIYREEFITRDLGTDGCLIEMRIAGSFSLIVVTAELSLSAGCPPVYLF